MEYACTCLIFTGCFSMCFPCECTPLHVSVFNNWESPVTTLIVSFWSFTGLLAQFLLCIEAFPAFLSLVHFVLLEKITPSHFFIFSGPCACDFYLFFLIFVFWCY